MANTMHEAMLSAFASTRGIGRLKQVAKKIDADKRQLMASQERLAPVTRVYVGNDFDREMARRRRNR